MCLALGVLRRLAGALQADLFALLDARVAGEEAGLAEVGALVAYTGVAMVSEKAPRSPSARARRPRNVRYVLDEAGAKTAVVLPIKEYERLMEDLFDRRLIADARSEPAVDIETVEARLIKDGLLPP